MTVLYILCTFDCHDSYFYIQLHLKRKNVVCLRETYFIYLRLKQMYFPSVKPMKVQLIMYYEPYRVLLNFTDDILIKVIEKLKRN